VSFFLLCHLFGLYSFFLFLFLSIVIIVVFICVSSSSTWGYCGVVSSTCGHLSMAMTSQWSSCRLQVVVCLGVVVVTSWLSLRRGRRYVVVVVSFCRRYHDFSGRPTAFYISVPSPFASLCVSLHIPYNVVMLHLLRRLFAVVIFVAMAS